MKARRRGAALLLALVICALAATLAVWMSWRQQLWITQTARLDARAELELDIDAIVDWARLVLLRDQQTGVPTNAAAAGERMRAAFTLHDRQVRLAIDDEQGKLNLNNLVANGAASPNDVAVYRRLLAALGLPASLADTLVAWLAPGAASPVAGMGQGLVNVDELALVKGYTSARVERLRPFVTALPERTAINVNAAPAQVLAALADDMSAPVVDKLLALRRTQPFTSVGLFRLWLPAGTRVDLGGVGVSSRWFLLSIRIAGARTALRQRVLLGERMDGAPRVAWRMDGENRYAVARAAE